MSTNSRRATSRAAATVLVAGALILAGCSGPGGDDGNGSEEPAEAQYAQADIDAALEEGADLVYWSWAPQAQGMVDEFNKEYPNMHVTLQNQGSGNDHYAKFQNVLAAGSGIPDVVQLESSVMPQFAMAGDAIVDFNEYGLDSLETDFPSAFWEASHFQGKLYGLPQDAGPVVMFYRADVFDEYGLDVPTTWDEYVETARKLKKAAPDKFIAADAGDAGTVNGLLWQAGARPYATDGDTVSINFDDDGTKTFIDRMTTLVDEGLIDTATAKWTPEWTAGLADGKYATWIDGAWGSGTLQNRIPEAAGKWRVAPMPQNEAGDAVSSQMGGSMTAVTQASTNKLAAVGFVQWMAATQEGSDTWTGLSGFPTYAPTLNSSEWQDVPLDYFDGQKANQLFAEISDSVASGWEFLPFQTYANSIFSDNVGGAYVGDTTFEQGLENWKAALLSYAKSQGFQTEG